MAKKKEKYRINNTFYYKHFRFKTKKQQNSNLEVLCGTKFLVKFNVYTTIQSRAQQTETQNFMILVNETAFFYSI